VGDDQPLYLSGGLGSDYASIEGSANKFADILSMPLTTSKQW